VNLKIKDPYCSTTALFTLANKAQQRFLTSFFMNSVSLYFVMVMPFLACVYYSREEGQKETRGVVKTNYLYL